jgi:curved DNA-binding protein CbpA
MLRRLSEQDYYQVLEVSYDASSEQIQGAYEEAREIYSHDALVTGSILSDQERRRAFERVAEAYQTLIAEESRRLYDESIGIARPKRAPKTLAEPAFPSAEPAPTADRAGSAERPEGAADSEEEGERRPTPRPPEPRVCPIQLGLTEEATGDFLRRARESLGLDLATISEETKIGRSVLEYIEGERLDRLPAPIYLRNFTLQIARCLGLDEEKVSRTYLARVRRLQSKA